MSSDLNVVATHSFVFFLAFCTLLLQLGLCILCMLCLWNCPVCISCQELQKVSFLTNLLGAEFKNPCGLLAFFFWALIGEIQYVVFCVFLWLVHFAFVLFVWYICVVFSLFVTKPSDWLWRMFLKGFVVCQLGQNLNLINRQWCARVLCCVSVSPRQQHGLSGTVRDCHRVFYKSHSARRLRLPVGSVHSWAVSIHCDVIDDLIIVSICLLMSL